MGIASALVNSLNPCRDSYFYSSPSQVGQSLIITGSGNNFLITFNKICSTVLSFDRFLGSN